MEYSQLVKDSTTEQGTMPSKPNNNLVLDQAIVHVCMHVLFLCFVSPCWYSLLWSWAVNQPTASCQLSPIKKKISRSRIGKRTPHIRGTEYEVRGNPKSKLQQTNRHSILGYLTCMHAYSCTKTWYLFTYLAWYHKEKEKKKGKRSL